MFGVVLWFWVVSMRQVMLLVIDLFLIALATVLALVLRDDLGISAARFADFAPYLVFTLAAAVIVLPALGTSRAVWRFAAMADYMRLVASAVAVAVCAVALGFGFNRMDGIARSLPILQSLLVLFSLVGVRILMRLWHAARERPVQPEGPKWVSGCETVLVVGLDELANLYMRSVAQFAPDRVRIAGLLDHNDRYIGRSVQGHPVVGSPEQISEVLRNLEVHGVLIDRIVVATAFEKLSMQAQDALLDIQKTTSISLAFLIEQMGLGLHTGGTAEADSSSASVTDNCAAFSIGADDLAVLTRRPHWRVRRALDFIAALGLLIVLAPLMLFVAILAAIDVGLPVTFCQQRPGLGGQPFKLHKIRTMAAAHDSRGRRVADEERTSGIGRFLRRTRLDELPQLLNILFGEMSFVGPRPLLPVDQPAAYAARILVRPGLTGWAQVKGGRAISAADKGALDVWYVRNASLALDFEIAWCTILMVIFGERVNATAIWRAWE